MLISVFRPTLRLALGDNPAAGTYKYSDAQLDAAIVGAMQAGQGPSCLALANNNTEITPDPNPDEFGYLLFQTALLMMGGYSPISYKTRAISVSESSTTKRDILTHLRLKIQELRDKGNICSGTGSETAGVFEARGAVHTTVEVWAKNTG